MSHKVVFETSIRRIQSIRRSALSFWIVAAFFAAGGIYYYSVDAGTDIHLATRRLVLGVTLVPVCGLVLIGVFFYARVRNAKGRIEITAEGVFFQIGQHHTQHSWREFVSVGDDLSLLFDKTPWYRTAGSLLLIRPPGLPKGRYARWRLRRLSERRIIRPRHRWGVTVLPLGLFSIEDARAISKTCRDAHSKATRA